MELEPRTDGKVRHDIPKNVIQKFWKKLDLSVKVKAPNSNRHKKAIELEKKIFAFAVY